METISNATNYNQVVEQAANNNYQSFLSIKPIINELTDMEKMIDNMSDIQNKFNELQQFQYFEGRNKSYERIMSKTINDMQDMLEANPDSISMFKFFNNYGICIELYNRVKGE